jgi:transposase-like protein
MQSVSQMIGKYAHQQLRNRIREIVQPGTLQAIFAQEMNSIIGDALNAQLVAERDQTLGRASYERKPGPSRNGFKNTKFPGLFGPLTLQRPVIRKGSLSSPLLTALKQTGRNLRDFLALRFWLRGASTRATASEINAALGTRLSHSTISTISNTLEPTLRDWESRPIPAGICYLFLDALYLPVRRPDFTSKQALLAALGLDENGRRYILGFMLGDRESQDSWETFLSDLLARGLSRDALRLIVSDEHKGIEAAVSSRLAQPHQLCLVHKLRNLRLRVASPDRKAFMADLHEVFWADDRETARQALGRLEARWQRAYPKAVELTLYRFEDYTRFFSEPKHFWTILRSNNLLERFNRELRRRLRPAGAMQSELEVLKLTWAVSEAQEQRWAKRKLWTKRTVQPMKKAA